MNYFSSPLKEFEYFKVPKMVVTDCRWSFKGDWKATLAFWVCEFHSNIIYSIKKTWLVTLMAVYSLIDGEESN